MILPERFVSMENLGNATQYLDEIMQLVDHIPLFEGFQPGEVATLCSSMICYGTSAGQTIIAEAEEGDFLIIVLTGAVNVVKVDGNGKKYVVQVGPGAVLGEMSMFSHQRRFASCITEQPCDFAVLTRTALNQLLLDNPRLANKLMLVLLHMITERLRESTYRLLPYLNGVAL